MSRRNLLGLIALIVIIFAAALVFAYHSGQKHPKPAVTPQTSATPSSSPSATPTTTPTTAAATSTPTPSATSGQCSTDDLTVALGHGSGAAGHTYYPLTFTNKSASSCTIYGYPGVSLVDSSGTQLGQPATRATDITPSTVTLESGEMAHANLALANPGAFDPSQCSATSTSLKVYPPNQTQAALVPFQAKTCGDFTVTAIAFGAGQE